MKNIINVLLIKSFLFAQTICLASENIPENINKYLRNTNPTEEQGNRFYDDVTIWAEKNPEAATIWAYNLQKEKGENDNTAVAAVLGTVRGISKQGPKKTFEWIKSNFKNEKERLNTIVDLAVVQAFQEVPVVQIAEAGNLVFEKNSQENIYIAQNFFSKVPQNQEDDVLKYGNLINDPQGLYKGNIIGPTLNNIAKRDFMKASSIWSNLENGNCKNLLFTTVIEKYLNQMKPQDVVQWIKTHEMSSMQRSSIENKIFKDWYLANKQEATLYFIERSKNCQPSEIYSFVNSIEKISPKEGLELISKIEDQNVRDGNFNLYAFTLYKNDTSKFNEIYKSNTNPEISTALRKALFNIYLSEDPKKACLYYQELTQDEKEASKVILWLSCFKWFEADSSKFMQWARTLKKEEFKSIISYLQATTKKFSSEENTKYIAEEMPLGQKRDEAFDKIVDQKAMQNPEEAINWAFSLKNESEKVQAIQKILMIWSVKDSAGTCDWITDNIKEYPDELEPTLMGPFVLLSNKDKKTALEKGKKIQNAKLKQLVIIGLQAVGQ